ncbi:hypothetical protein FB561_5694 [Kribbella amoyensis]|uniref:Uncharacterized protein n=1 Tax=Kribbella amoyensis TaxID=996641 RepID=A0A561C020_9ACTN|nr:hypothetical protein [Kribbella amoyensis]TWD84503.1 hypothetical protein FB561_5694 [Kribbella amoyensis]
MTARESTANRVQFDARSLLSDTVEEALWPARSSRPGLATSGRARPRVAGRTKQIEKNVYAQQLPRYDDLKQLADQIRAALGSIAIRPDVQSPAQSAHAPLLSASPLMRTR